MNRDTFAIITDSNCDLTLEHTDTLGVEVVPMPFILDEDDYSGKPGSTLPLTEFYAKMRAGAIAKTYQKTPDDYVQVFLPHVKAGRAILLVSMSSTLSATYNSSLMARATLLEQYPQAQIVCLDSQLISCAQGLLVEAAVAKRRQGCTLEETIAHLEGLKHHIGICFTADDLKYLRRGGRLSAASAVVGTIMNIKPILRLESDSTLASCGKVRGRKNALQEIVEIVLSKFDAVYGNKIYVVHADAPEAAGDLADELLKKLPDAEIAIEYLGHAVGAHAGPETVGIVYPTASRT